MRDCAGPIGLCRTWWCCALLLAGLLGVVRPVGAAGRGEPGTVTPARVELTRRVDDLRLFGQLDLDVSGVFDGWAELYLVPDEMRKLRELGYRVTPLPPVRPRDEALPQVPGQRIPTAYHTYETLRDELLAIRDANPTLARLFTLGQSVQGRELWMMKISDNPDVEEDEPEVAYVAAMHGDEVVGKELCVELLHYLLDNYGSDSRVTDLVDDTEIWIMPSMNPDGTALAQRYNANGFDLNRNFPDWFDDPVNTTAGRQAETRALMDWVAAHSINLSANFHGGALVANYPFDNNPSGSSVPSPTPAPDDPLFYSIALTYAQNNTPMYTSPIFPNGVTNGADWYAVSGGLQDWGYTWYGKFDVTLEISNTKWPAASQLPTFWNNNRESMLSYLERAHEGLRGLVGDAVTGQPVAAAIRLDANPFAVHTDPDVGDYHRMVLPGSYSMQVSAPGYYPQTIPVSVTAGPAARYDVLLQPLPSILQPVAERIEDGPSGNGWLDAGEGVDLAVTLKNEGSGATGVSGRLVPTGWYGQVTRETAAFPDIPNQQTRESQPPHFAVYLDPAVPAGHHVGFAVEWSAAQGSAVSEPFFLDVGAPLCAGGNAQDVPKSILDYQTVVSQLTVATVALVENLTVTVDISHTYINDLKLTLISPAGTRVVLHNRTGGSANDIVGTYGVDLTAAQSLAALDGQATNGTWRLEINDNAGGDTGTLHAWSLESCGPAVETAMPEMRLREVTRQAGGVQLRWWAYPGVLSYRVYRSTDATSAAAFLDVTSEDGNATDTVFIDTSTAPLVYYLVTAVGPQGEGP